MEDEDEVFVNSKGSSRRRLNALRAVLRRAIQDVKGNDADIIKGKLKTLLPDMTDQEIETCSNICIFLIPFIPEKTKMFSIAHQLPFFLMANDLSRIARYTKLCATIAPLPKLNSLVALQIDAPLLFSLFSISPNGKNMNVYDPDNTIIANRACATESKDGVFSSFFDIKKLYTLCSNHGLVFAQNIYLPGMKLVRINGSAKNTPPSNSVLAVKDKGKQKAVSHKVKGDSSEKASNVVPDAARIARLQAVVDKIQKELQELIKEKSSFLIDNRIGLIKKGWVIAENASLLSSEQIKRNKSIFDQVGQLKRSRNELN